MEENRKKPRVPKRFAIFFFVFGFILLLLILANVLINQKNIQEKFAAYLYQKSQIKIGFDDLSLQLFTGNIKGKKISLQLEKNKMGIELNEFTVRFNPFFFLIGKIKIDTIEANQITLDTSHFIKTKDQKSEKNIPKFLRQIKLQRASINQLRWDQGADKVLQIDNINLTSKFGSVITRNPTIMKISNFKYHHPQFDIFVDHFVQDGFFIIDLSQPRILNESKISNQVNINNVFLSVKKKKKHWLTNAAWDADLMSVIKKYYGGSLPDDRSYLYISDISFDIEKNESSTLLHYLYVKINGGKLSANGEYKTMSKKISLHIFTDSPLPISKLPLGQSQFRTAFESFAMDLKLDGQINNLKNHDLNLNFSGKLLGNNVNPESGDAQISAEGKIKDRIFNLSHLQAQLRDGKLNAAGSLHLNDFNSQVDFNFDNFDLKTVMRLFSTQNISGKTSGKGSLSGKLTKPKIQITLSSPDAMFEFLHFGAAKGDLHIENDHLKLNAQTQNSQVGSSSLDMNIQNVFDPFQQILTLKTAHKNIDVFGLLQAQSLKGNISGDFQLNRKNAIVTANGDFITKNFLFFDNPVGDIKTKLAVNKKHLKVSPIVIELVDPNATILSQTGFDFDFNDSGYKFDGKLVPEMKVSGSYQKNNPDVLHVEFDKQNMPLRLFQSLLPFKLKESSLTGLTKLEYNLKEPTQSQMQSHLKKVNIETLEGHFALKKPTVLQYKNKSFIFNNLEANLGRGHISLDGVWGLEQNSSIKIKGLIDFDLVADYNPFISESENPIQVDVTLKEDMRKPKIYGKVDFKNEAVAFRSMLGDYEEINGMVYFEGNKIKFDKINFLYNDAPVTIDGFVAIDYQTITAAQLKIKGSEVPFHTTAGLNILTDIDLSLSGSGNLALKGGVNIVDGTYSREFGINNFQLKFSTFTDDEENQWGMLPNNMALDLQVKNTGDFNIKNPITELELNTDLHIAGTLKNPLIGGQVDIMGGQIDAFGINFEDASGYIQFKKRPNVNPDVNLIAKKDFQEYEITARISGQLENLKLDLSSTPSLDRREILSILFYGNTPDQLTGDERAQFTQTAAISQLATVLSRPIHKISGLDVVRVSARQESSTQTIQRFSLGKKISKRLNFGFTTDLGIEDPERAFEFQYHIFDSINLIFAKDLDDRSRYRFDVNVRFEIY